MRAGQQGLLGSDRNFEQAEGGANLGSDPNNPHPNNPDPNNPGSNLNCLNTRTASALASNCVVEVDALLSVFILAPLIHPRLLPAPPGGKKEPTALFGRANKRRKYTRQGTLNNQ